MRGVDVVRRYGMAKGPTERDERNAVDRLRRQAQARESRLGKRVFPRTQAGQIRFSARLIERHLPEIRAPKTVQLATSIKRRLDGLDAKMAAIADDRIREHPDTLENIRQMGETMDLVIGLAERINDLEARLESAESRANSRAAANNSRGQG